MRNKAVTIRYMLAAMLVVSEACANLLSGGDTDGYWGTWGKAAFCPPGKFVFGYRLRSEGRQGRGDDTALNGIDLLCYRPHRSGYRTIIRSKSGPWGHLSEFKTCGYKPVTGFAMKIESRQGRGDDTAANDVDLYCEGGRHISAWTATSWGRWTPPRICDHGWAVSGIVTRVEDGQGSGDDTALNGVRMYCKPYE